MSGMLGLPGPVLAALAIVLGILLIGTVVVAVLTRRRGIDSTRELSARVTSW